MLTFGLIIGAIVWFIGSCITLHDLLNNGKGLKEYRAKYGHDLGMLVCCFYWGMMIAVWPVMGLGGFFLGVLTDTVRLVVRRKPVTVEK